uniref:Large ribosomal subunit protein eL18 n=1 Tax=Ditylenchus dipsaci TaxID=166011 RepID=A0A915EET9_9BILA
MGIDLCHKFDRKVRRTAPKSEDPYLRVLTKLYRYLANRVEGPNKFNKVIVKRLFMAKRNLPPLSIARLVRTSRSLEMKRRLPFALGPSLTTIESIKSVPAITVAAMRFTAAARARIINAGGEAITVDQLALRSPKGENTLLLQGCRKNREAERHFGPAPGVPGSHTKPFVRSKGRKFERARGRRKSRGYKSE